MAYEPLLKNMCINIAVLMLCVHSPLHSMCWSTWFTSRPPLWPVVEIWDDPATPKYLSFDKLPTCIRTQEEWECGICFEENITQWAITSCDHYFCVNCLQQWIQKSLTCPICRTEQLSYQLFAQMFVQKDKQR